MKIERVTKNLQQAIATMRQFCDTAERSIDTDDSSYAIQRVLHSLSWGFANASSSVEIAMEALEDDHEIQTFRANETKKDAS